jgi:2-dehydro-3-deoxy-D-arabinonate dehydratase
MLLYRTAQGAVARRDDRWCVVPNAGWDALINNRQLHDQVAEALHRGPPMTEPEVLAPIEGQEVWAAGVTYLRSRSARMRESEIGGASDFYDRVYHAERPELFFKANRHRVIAPGKALHLRSDSRWVVPEPELALLVNRRAEVVGYTVGNDLSCRDIEGENPLYLPQAKIFDGCAALGPGIWLSPSPPPIETEIAMEIRRGSDLVYQGSTQLSRMNKPLPTLVEYLFRDNSFPEGCFLLSGTGVVPPDDFCLRAGDEVRIRIDPIGTLVNTVA